MANTDLIAPKFGHWLIKALVPTPELEKMMSQRRRMSHICVGIGAMILQLQGALVTAHPPEHDDMHLHSMFRGAESHNHHNGCSTSHTEIVDEDTDMQEQDVHEVEIDDAESSINRVLKGQSVQSYLVPQQQQRLELLSQQEQQRQQRLKLRQSRIKIKQMQSDESSQVPSSQPSSMPSSMPSEQASLNVTKATRPGNPPGINKLKTNSATIDTGGEEGSDINISVSPTPKPTRKGNPPGINKLKTNSDTVSNNDINVIKGGRGKKKQTQKDGRGKKKQTQKDGRGKKKKQNNNNSRPIKKTTNIGNQNQKQKEQQIQKNQQVKKAQQMEKKQTLKQQYMSAMQAQQDNNMVTLDGTLSTQAEAGGIEIQTGDLYRTCLDRLQNRGTGFTYENIVHTNMSPFVARNEQLMQGTMYISLLQDSTEMNDKAVQQMEEFTLSYLADNIGGNNFEPVCVQCAGCSYDKGNVQTGESSKKNNGRKKKNIFNRDIRDGGRELEREIVESNTCRLEVSYIQRMGPIDNNRSLEGEDLLDEQDSNISIKQAERELQVCTPLDRAQCCSQNSINQAPGQFCTSVGCNVQRCGTGRQRPRRVNFFGVRSLLAAIKRRLYPAPFTLKDTDYTLEMNRHTDFTPEECWAELGVENLVDVASCSVNRYSLEKVCCVKHSVNIVYLFSPLITHSGHSLLCTVS